MFLGPLVLARVVREPRCCGCRRGRKSPLLHHDHHCRSAVYIIHGFLHLHLDFLQSVSRALLPRAQQAAARQLPSQACSSQQITSSTVCIPFLLADSFFSGSFATVQLHLHKCSLIRSALLSSQLFSLRFLALRPLWVTFHPYGHTPPTSPTDLHPWLWIPLISSSPRISLKAIALTSTVPFLDLPPFSFQIPSRASPLSSWIP